ncbi:MAG: hypothetical protein IPK97_07470 [Ahniella sp.]|nr:hypothetical protein [Ahniella sp.]
MLTRILFVLIACALANHANAVTCNFDYQITLPTGGVGVRQSTPPIGVSSSGIPLKSASSSR